MVSSAHGRGLGRMVSPFQGSGLSEARCGLSRLMEEPSHRCPWLCAAGRTCLCLLSVCELAELCKREACVWQGGVEGRGGGGVSWGESRLPGEAPSGSHLCAACSAETPKEASSPIDLGFHRQKGWSQGQHHTLPPLTLPSTSGGPDHGCLSQ